MVTHMKTTVDIADPILAEAKQLAAAEGITLRELIEEGLRRMLGERRDRRRFKLSDASFRGRGLQTGVHEGDWASIREQVYEGRGG